MELSYQLWNKTGQDPANPSSSVPRIVLLHGMGGTGNLWRPIGAALEDTAVVLALDQRGHGGSLLPETPGSRNRVGYTPLDYGRDIVETLETLRFHPTWIVGHSMGVRTAVAASHLRPDWVTGLVLIDLGFSGVAGGGLGENLGRFLRILPTEFQSRDEARQFMAEHCPDPSMAQYLMAVSQRSAEGHLSFPFDRAALIQTIESARDSSVRQWVVELTSLNKPVLVLRGKNSLVWSHEDFEREKALFAKSNSAKFVEVSDAGHGLPFEQRAKFVEILKDFIESAPS